MEWFALIVPIFLGILGLTLYRHKLVWWEILLPIIVCAIAIGVSKHIMISNLTSDTEYLSEYVTQARYYEKWDEYIHKTCTRTVSCGKNCTRTVTYDCSYVKYHSAYWEIRTNVGNKYRITKEYYKSIVKLFGNEVFVDMHRDYHYNDGDMYKTVFDGVFEHVIPMTYKHEYENKTQAVNTVFKFYPLDSIQRKKVVEYPPIINDSQMACIGCLKSDDTYLRRKNALIGRKHQIKVFIIKMKDGVSVAELQRQYWKGGNKNELVVCVGDNWAKTFSWSDDKRLEVESNDIFSKDIPMKQKIDLLEHEIETKWVRKKFSDFDYIKVPLTTSNIIVIYIITLILSVGILIWGVRNDIEQ